MMCEHRCRKGIVEFSIKGLVQVELVFALNLKYIHSDIYLFIENHTHIRNLVYIHIAGSHLNFFLYDFQ